MCSSMSATIQNEARNFTLEGGPSSNFSFQSHNHSHILSQQHVLTSFTYIFVFHLGQNKRSYEAIKHGYMNNFHVRCRGFRIFFIHRGEIAENVKRKSNKQAQYQFVVGPGGLFGLVIYL
jgi:hypothetical protein